MKWLRSFLLFTSVLILYSWITYRVTGSNTLGITSAKSSRIYEKLQAKASEARQFCLKKGYNNQYCFLIDMSLPSGQGRFIIYDLKKDTIESQGLVAHGNCFEYWLEGRKYSNT